MNTETVSTVIASSDNHMFVLMEQFARLFADPDVTDQLFELRFHALRELHGIITALQKRNYHARLLLGIAKKKGDMILAAKSKTELREILHPKEPHFNGVRFQPGPYLTPEEELICWSEASLRAPLNSAGYERFKERFCEVLPEEAARLWGDGE